VKKVVEIGKCYFFGRKIGVPLNDLERSRRQANPFFGNTLASTFAHFDRIEKALQ